MSVLVRDLRYSLRLLRKRSGFTAAVIATLALGIGANTAIFSLVHAVLLRPLPFADAENLVLVRDAFLSDNGERERMQTNGRSFDTYRREPRSFSGMAIFGDRRFNMTGTDEPQTLRGSEVSANSLALLGIVPIVGRGFTPEDDRAGAPAAVALIAYRLWQRQFGGELDAIGKEIRLDGRPHTVIGVLPPGVEFPELAELWVPLGYDSAQEIYLRRSNYDVVARLAPGVSLAAAQAEMTALSTRMATENISNRGWSTELVPIRSEFVGNVRPPLIALFCAVGCVLLIACVNVANLFLTRAVAEGRELAIRSALGASAGRLIRQCLTSSVLCGALGGAFGLALALWAMEPLRVLIPTDWMPSFFDQVGLNWIVLGFTLFVSVAAGAGFGLIPALRSARPELVPLLRDGSRSSAGTSGRRLQRTFVIAEIALAMVLLSGAGLMVRAFWDLLQRPVGVDPRQTLLLSLQLPASKYPDGPQKTKMVDSVLEQVRALPGVLSAGTTTQLPLTQSSTSARFAVEGRVPAKDEILFAYHRMVSPGYLESMRIPLLQGRSIAASDREDAPPVVVVSREMARRFWPGENPVGRRIKRGAPTMDRPWITVIGVAEDVPDFTLEREPESTWYLPYAQVASTKYTDTVTLAVRTAIEPGSLLAPVRAAIAKIDAEQPVFEVSTLAQRFEQASARRRTLTVLLGAVALTALLLAAVGIYGVMAYSVSQRLHEMGIRAALGASPSDLVRMVLGEGMSIAVIGLGLGLLGALAAGPLISSLLLGVAPHDPGILLAVASILGLVALLACVLPARRAMQVDPIVALRSE